MPAMISTADADELLAALDPLPHADRLRHTAVTARRLAARDALRPLLTALDARGPYERRLAALAALTAGDLGHLEARLADPDPVVRRYALRGARRLPVRDRAVEAAYDDAPAVVRADLARLLRDGRRPALAERLVPRLRTAYGDRDAARLLPGCSTEFTARLLPELAGALAFEDWSTLALRHPAAVLDHAERELRDLPERPRERWWQQHGTGIAAALPAAPGRVLDLLEQRGPYTLPGPVHERLGDLVAVDAERVARWLADRPAHVRWERTPGPAVMRRLAAADPPTLPRLGARWLRRNAVELLLRSMPPARRAGFVDDVAAVGRARGGTPSMPQGVLALLPAAERHARARAAIAELRADRAAFWDLRGQLCLLPPAEAGPELLAALGTGDPDVRGAVWDGLAVSAALTRDPREVAEVLALAAGRLANDRDPVRAEALAAFADLSVPLLVAALTAVAGTGSAGARTGADSLERLCLDALSARDCSFRTRDGVRTLAVSLLAAAPGPSAARTAAVRLVEALAAHTGTVDLGQPAGSLPGTAVPALLEALGPWLDRAAACGDVAPLLALTAACGRHGHRNPELQNRLGQALRSCPDGVFGQVAEAWLADPATRGDRVAELLAREPSAAFLAPVLAVLATERTDLLNRALPGEPLPGGRFPAAGTPRPLPPLPVRRPVAAPAAAGRRPAGRGGRRRPRPGPRRTRRPAARGGRGAGARPGPAPAVRRHPGGRHRAGLDGGRAGRGRPHGRPGLGPRRPARPRR